MTKRVFSVLTLAIGLLPACDRLPVEMGQPTLLQPFAGKHGRILAFPAASDYGAFDYDKSNRLAYIFYNNGVTDLYAYDDDGEVVEVTRDDANAEPTTVFTFDLVRGLATRLSLVTGEIEERRFALGDQSYDSLFPVGHFDGTTLSGDGVSPDPEVFTGDCVCQVGHDSVCEGNDTEKKCELDTCTYKGNTKDCVWRRYLLEQ